MAMFKSKTSEVTNILATHLHDNIKIELKEKLMRLVEQDINQIVNDTVNNLVSKIESYHGTTGEIQVNILFKDAYK